MEGQTNVLLIVLLFVLRLGIPVLVTVAIAYGLRRLDAKWQAEAEAEAKAGAKPLVPQAPRPQPARSGNGASITPPLRQPIPLAVAGGQPCWAAKGCSDSMRATCAAFNQPDVPCWTARLTAEGHLPTGCKDCKLYQPAAPVWTEQGMILH